MSPRARVRAIPRPRASSHVSRRRATLAFAARSPSEARGRERRVRTQRTRDPKADLFTRRPASSLTRRARGQEGPGPQDWCVLIPRFRDRSRAMRSMIGRGRRRAPTRRSERAPASASRVSRCRSHRATRRALARRRQGYRAAPSTGRPPAVGARAPTHRHEQQTLVSPRPRPRRERTEQTLTRFPPRFPACPPRRLARQSPSPWSPRCPRCPRRPCSPPP